MTDDDLHSLSGAYAVDAVDEDERARFEQHLATCAECRDEVAGLRAAGGELAATTSAAPPASLKAAVLRDIASVRPLPPVVADDDGHAPGDPGPSPVMNPVPGPAPDSATDLGARRAERHRGRRAARGLPWLAGVAAAVLIAVAGIAWHPWSPGQGKPPLTAAQQVLQAKDAQRVEQSIGAATATVVRSASLNRAVLLADNLPPAPDGKVYELWLQRPGGHMVKAGLMPQSTARHQTFVLSGDAAAAIAAGITVEPAGGSEQPTTAPLALFPFA